MVVTHHCKYFKIYYLLLLASVISLTTICYFFLNEYPKIIPIITTSTITLLKPPTPTCIPYTVPDNRPFFEREPPQLNLPRRISYPSDEDLRRHCRSLRLITLACAYNVEAHIDKFRRHIEPIVDLFHPTSRILVLESDSTDKTVEKLFQWPRVQVYTHGNMSKQYPVRVDRIAYCRNKLLNKAHELKGDYMLMADIDRFSTDVSSFLSNFRYNTDDWSVMTASTSHVYYDIWALRTLSDSNMNFDVWHRVWEIEQSNKGYCAVSISVKIVNNHQRHIPTERNLIEVRSAFGGAGLYKANITHGCEYSGANNTCEHVPFHLCIREKNRARIFINPAFLVE